MSETAELRIAESVATWIRKNDLPAGGFVCLHDGKPFKWTAELPEPSSVVPGVVAVDVASGQLRTAFGGDYQGANGWLVNSGDCGHADSAAKQQRLAHADGISYAFTLEFATEVKQLIGRDAGEGKFTWETAGRLCQQIVQAELGVEQLVESDPSQPIFVNFRAMRDQDMAEVLAIEAASKMNPWSALDLTEASRRNQSACMVVESDSLAGFFIYTVFDSEVIIDNMVVHPRMIRRRVGAQIITHLRRVLLQYSRQALAVTVREDVLPAQLFFQAMGFFAEKVIHNHFDDGVDVYVMRRPL